MKTDNAILYIQSAIRELSRDMSYQEAKNHLINSIALINETNKKIDRRKKRDEDNAKADKLRKEELAKRVAEYAKRRELEGNSGTSGT